MECYTSSSSSDLEAGFYAFNNCKMSQQKPKTKRSNTVNFFCDGFDYGYDEQHYFLDSCFLCNKPLTGNKDIFMYRGDTAFCSEECREEQIEIDEAKEKNSKMFRASKQQQKQTQQQKGGRVHVRAPGAVVAGYC